MSDPTSTFSPPPTEPAAAGGPPPAAPRVLRRRDGPLGGVAAGVAAYLDQDPLLIRIAFVVSAALGGLGVFLYLAAWVLLPTVPQDPSARPVTVRNDTVPVVVGSVLLVLGAWIVLGLQTDGGLLVPLLLVGLGVYLLNQRPTPSGTSGTTATPTPVQTPGSWQPPAAPSATPPTPAAPGAPSLKGAPGTIALATTTDPTQELSPFAAEPPPPPPPPGPGSAWGVAHGPTEASAHQRPPAGPPITSITLAVLAVVIGALLALDGLVAADVSAVVLTATALVVIGLGLLASAFLGRARGLIPLGLLAVLALAVSPAVDAVADTGIGDREIRVASAAELEPRYELGVGELVLDLRDLSAADLDRELAVSVDIGRAEIIVPDGVLVEVEGSASAGYVEAFGVERDGAGAELRHRDGPVGPDVLRLDAEVGLGALVVTRG